MASRHPKIVRSVTFILPVLLIASMVATLVVLVHPSANSRRLASTETASSSRVESRFFFSTTLSREMPYYVFLPPGYDSDRSRRYPVVYMLHGLSGTNEEWRQYGIFEAADRLISAAEIQPMIVVLPQGDDSYWVDHAGDGPRWGYYVATDVTGEIDGHFRPLAGPRHRGIGGLSMGADGALQLALNYPETFGVVAAESPVLRRYADAFPFFGDEAWFAAHDPVSLVAREPGVASGLVISLEVGSLDLWLDNVIAFHQELVALGVPHRWRISPGGHDAAFWTEHVKDDLRFFDDAFRAAAP